MLLYIHVQPSDRMRNVVDGENERWPACASDTVEHRFVERPEFLCTTAQYTNITDTGRDNLLRLQSRERQGRKADSSILN